MADALFLAGDRYHVADEAFAGVGPVLESAGLEVDYTTDFSSIDAHSLDGKRLLVFLRDGMEWPDGHDSPPVRWMQPHQEEAIENFVKDGGSFLVLHNSAWDYPHEGGYRRTVALRSCPSTCTSPTVTTRLPSASVITRSKTSSTSSGSTRTGSNC